MVEIKGNVLFENNVNYLFEPPATAR